MCGVPGLKSQRIAKGITQRELAHTVGLHVISISRFETGKSNARQRVLEALAIALDCSVKDLLFPEVDNVSRN